MAGNPTMRRRTKEPGDSTKLRWQKKPAAMTRASCPVNHGLRTTMLRGSFARTCVRYQQEEDSNCRFICGGVWPKPGLTLVDKVEDFNDTAATTLFSDKEMETMAMENTKRGTCELCGQSKNLKSIRGKRCCATCEHVWRASLNDPELLIKALDQGRGEEYLREKFGGSAVVAEVLTEPVPSASESMVKWIVSAYNLDLETDIPGFVDNLVAEVDMLKISRDAATKTLATIRETIADLGAEESILEAISRIQRDRQRAVDICFETMGILGSVFSAADNLPVAAREIMAELQALRGLKESCLEDREIPDFSTAGLYDSLQMVLDLAYQQAANGKGKERHAKDGEPFERQKICEIARRVGLGFPIGQAVKKAEKSVGLGVDAGIRENLGAINYLAAAVIVMEEAAAGGSFHVPV